MLKHLEKENFKEVIKEGVWLVDFYADWCGPCKMLGSVLAGIDANILKVNVDIHGDLATEFGVMSIPTICFFKDGKLEKREIGFRTELEIKNLLDSVG